ncbi:hypothetical protein ACW5R3_11790 [Bizionia sp. KMM 8389]
MEWNKGLLVVCVSNLYVQTSNIQGHVVNQLEAKNVHVINKAANKFTTTNM